MRKKEDLAKILITRNSREESIVNSKNSSKSKRILCPIKPKVTLCESENRFSVLSIQEASTITCEISADSKKSSVTKKMQKQKIKRRQVCQKKKKMESSHNIFPLVVRCEKCFISHFPSPRICSKSKNKQSSISNAKRIFIAEFLSQATVKRSLDVSIFPYKKLTGGAQSDSIPLMIRKAIENARKHGINLTAGIRNNADGNCAYESVLNNINNRDCFQTKLTLHPNIYRRQWISELEKEAANNPNIAPSVSEEEKKHCWERLKMPYVYQVPYFGDFVMHAIAMGCKKNLLIFNTSPEAADPIYVIESGKFGGKLDSEFPVVIAYNQSHYESLHPLSIEDREKTKTLVNTYVNGSYSFTKKDIPYLINFKSENKNLRFVSSERTDDLKTLERDKNLLEVTKRKSLRVRDMTVEDRRAYHRQKYQERKAKLVPVSTKAEKSGFELLDTHYS